MHSRRTLLSGLPLWPVERKKGKNWTVSYHRGDLSGAPASLLVQVILVLLSEHFKLHRRELKEERCRTVGGKDRV